MNNQARQAKITNDISEIVGGAEVLGQETELEKHRAYDQMEGE